MAVCVVGSATQSGQQRGSLMEQAPHLGMWWLSRWRTCATVCTRPGGVRVVPGGTGRVLGGAEQPRTPRVTALGLASRWRVREDFAEDGAWAREVVERQPRHVSAQEQPARWGPDPPVAVADTQLPRTSQPVGGTCPCHASRARRPHRAESVRAHNGVVRGDVVPGHPGPYVPPAARLSCRPSQRPPGESCRTQTAVAVEVWRQADRGAAAPRLAVFDGASAVDPVIQPCLHPAPGHRQIALVTRRRVDARR
jgi:hypothetical protein